MPDPAARCSAAPAGESHRWRLPSTGAELAATCRYCHAEKVFTPFEDAATAWAMAGERMSHYPPGFVHLAIRRRAAKE
jgi:hypothetical protein